MHRRDFVLGALGAGLASTGSMSLLFPVGLSANAAAATNTIPYGAAIRVDNLESDPDYAAAVRTYCQQVVGEGGLKWFDLRPDRSVFNFDQPDRLIAFADANGMTMRGHTLVWYAALPEWTKDITASEAEFELTHHIEVVVGRYRGRIPNWDVVNEPISEDPAKEGPLRDSIWLQALGKGYIELAFRTAAATDPDARLVLNDFNFEKTTEVCRQRRVAMLDLLKELKDRDVPVHALGLQGHLTGEAEIDKEGLSRFVEEVSGLGLDIYVTELDVIDNNLPAAQGVRDQIAALRVRDYLTAICDVVEPKAILTWGISDKYTWVPIWFKRRDGLLNRPLPLDENFQPKAMMQVLQEFTRAGS
ncbi:endo-1,4-beta-xylanase [Labrenzia sp. 011]|uniref:endo-1,4-beta-xylanase n=1 Tax=Labrenzia sp. 011 TaxID=2171494 RepID=UPI000D52433C|nr:endo-1,4-beta-xylanase [Labrenzia sp. 011]PVB60670.1 glycoside hydrolase family 10 [Labrenzia sp. 011]